MPTPQGTESRGEEVVKRSYLYYEGQQATGLCYQEGVIEQVRRPRRDGARLAYF